MNQTQTPIAGMGKGDVRTLIPIIAFDMILSDEDASTEQLPSFFTNFLDGVLAESSRTYRFDYSHLECDVIISIFDQRQPLDTGYGVRMNGIAYYFDAAPTSESLAQSLKVYFSFWGAQDLQDYLKDLGLESAIVASVSIDGETVSFVSNEDDEESRGDQNSGNMLRNIFYEDGGDLSKPAVASAYVAAVLIAVAIALIVFRHRLGRRRNLQNGDKQSHETHSGTNSAIALTPVNGGRDEEMGFFSEEVLKTYSMNGSEKKFEDPKTGMDKSRPIDPDSAQIMKSDQPVDPPAQSQ